LFGGEATGYLDAPDTPAGVRFAPLARDPHPAAALAHSAAFAHSEE